MLPQLEHSTVVDTNPLKNTVPIEEPVIKYGYLGILFCVIFAVDVDLHLCRCINTNQLANDKQFFVRAPP